jgi:hypothetical protein
MQPIFTSMLDEFYSCKKWVLQPAGPTLQPLAGWRHSVTHQEAAEENPKLKVIGGRTPWPVGHVARPAGHHLCMLLTSSSR